MKQTWAFVDDVPRPPHTTTTTTPTPLLRLFVTVSAFSTILPLIVSACWPEDSNGVQPISACWLPHTLWSRACLACYRKCLLAATLGSLIWSMSHSVIISLFWNFFHGILISSCLRVGFAERWLMRETSFLEWKRHKWWCFLGQLRVVVQGILQKTATCAVLSQFLQQ